MIGYVTVGTNDLETACAFFDALLSEIGIARLWSVGHMAAWGPSRADPVLCVVIPHDGTAATAGNGTMIAFKRPDRSQVDLLHAKALALGGKNEGAPGPRGEHGFYGAYFRDPDGNKFCVYVAA